jgi:NAD(P)H-hydrate epimerase
MKAIYAESTTKKWDEFTIENTPISSLDLMERSAIQASKKIIGSFNFLHVSIFCGRGNNGGDGLAIARILNERGKNITVYLIATSAPTTDYLANLNRLPSACEVVQVDENTINQLPIKGDLIVDALFGSGLSRPIVNWIQKVIHRINDSKLPIVSIGLPSGLMGDDNSINPLESVVKANHTLSFQRPKMSFFFDKYAPFVGRFSILDIGLLDNFIGDELAMYVDQSSIQLKQENNFIHKGNKGYLVLVAGSQNMMGAAILSSKSAFRAGCGYVGLISPKLVITPLMVHLPEAIWLGDQFESLPEKTTAIAIGPGIGINKVSYTHLKLALNSNLPLVIDADAINLLAIHPELIQLLPKNSILTPHYKELTRLIGTADSPEKLLKKQLEFSIEKGVYVIQKGAYSKLTTPTGQVFINSTGNSSMASAGMGDILTGIIGSFLAQGYVPQEAAIYGIYLHGLAGDHAVLKLGNRGLLASDLIDELPKTLSWL